MRSRSALERNLGLAAAASFSRCAFKMSSTLGGCFLCDAHPFLTFFGASDGPSSSSGGGGGGLADGGGGGGIVSVMMRVSFRLHDRAPGLRRRRYVEVGGLGAEVRPWISPQSQRQSREHVTVLHHHTPFKTIDWFWETGQKFEIPRHVDKSLGTIRASLSRATLDTCRRYSFIAIVARRPLTSRAGSHSCR